MEFERLTDDGRLWAVKYDAEQMESLILDINGDESLDELFRPLENLRSSEMVLGKEKAKGRRDKNMNKVRDKLISLGIFDYDALKSCDNETDK